MYRYRLLILNTILLLTLVCSYWGRRLEDAPVTKNDFLKGLSLPFHNLATQEVDISAEEREMLQPDSVLIRRYGKQVEGHFVEAAELAVIAGHHKKSVHTPGFCLAGGGWETLWQKEGEIGLGERSIPTQQALMNKEGARMLVTYFFTNGEYCSRNLMQFQGVQFLRRLRSQVPEGALVRIVVPLYGKEEEAKALTEEFAQATLPGTLEALRQVQISIP